MLNIIQLIIAILLIVTILLQQRGSGLGAAFGGESAVYRTKRGAEKTIFYLTIILAVLFLGLALVNIYLNTQDGIPALPSDATPDALESELPPADELPLDDSTPTDPNEDQIPEDEDEPSSIFNIGEPEK